MRLNCGQRLLREYHSRWPGNSIDGLQFQMEVASTALCPKAKTVDDPKRLGVGAHTGVVSAALVLVPRGVLGVTATGVIAPAGRATGGKSQCKTLRVRIYAHWEGRMRDKAGGEGGQEARMENVNTKTWRQSEAQRWPAFAYQSDENESKGRYSSVHFSVCVTLNTVL